MLSKKTALSDSAQAWLRSDKTCGFFKFKPQAELAALWQEHGDLDSMFCDRDMMLPIAREELEANEDAWLNRGEFDEYDTSNFFIRITQMQRSKNCGARVRMGSATNGGQICGGP